MRNKLNVEQNENHIGGNFKWKHKPKCSCGKIAEAVEERFLFVSNFVDDLGETETNVFYLLPVDADGFLFRSNGVPISHCPWCGDKIIGLKAYAKNSK